MDAADDRWIGRRRIQTLWSAFGWIVHGLFAVMVYYLFWFLRGADEPAPTTTAWALAIDGLLTAQFALSHSGLLLPAVRQRLTRRMPAAVYGVFYCAVTTISMSAVIAAWQPCGDPLWNVHGLARRAIHGAYYASWVLTLYSLYLSGYGHQTGWSSWWPWVRGRVVPARRFEPRGVFLWLRHPVYLSFLGLIWFVPCMTIDRALLTAVWTTYVFVGSYLKDRRMEHYLGTTYREYQAAVPGYPLMPFGPLGRLNSPQLAEESVPTT
jgi:methanethiol S-methyltransferase